MAAWRQWQFGDASFPRGVRTFFAGTYCKHPISMVAVSAVLDHIIEHGDTFYPALNRASDGFVSRLNSWWAEQGIGLRIDNCRSMFRFIVPPEVNLAFFQTLNTNGVYCWEGRSCYLNTAHTEEDFERMVLAVQQA